jgi:hypothetical protein
MPEQSSGARQTPKPSGSGQGALLATIHVAPTLALLITVTLYVLSPPSALAPQDAYPAFIFALTLGLALVCLVVAWLLVSAVIFWLGSTRADRIIPGTYAEIRSALVAIDTVLAMFRTDTSHGDASGSHAAPSTANPDPNICGALCAFRQELQGDLEADGPQWALGYGYINLIRRAHRAEEAMILVQELPVVIAGARYDAMRIAESSLSNRS